ncbi:DUF3843 family protein [Labilibaculum manganireducens]|uniref:DUF3843 family protein n=1 Tax=Labilibaculum manganireducens TaxID=1940525 RepID=UPI0029F4E89F|nr:DUF3843 family protein [Labilibaculum manganireducens]
MKKQKERIYIQQWLELKPYEKQTITDSYYLKISNEVKQAVITNKQSFVLQRFLNDTDIDLLACFLTSYFEDIISGTNIWNSFAAYHTELYNKPLPFYNVDEYYTEEINPQDISFLIWYFMNTIQNDKFIAPLNDFIVETANKVMNVFDSAWDDAPQNELLKTAYTLTENETNFYIARNLIDTILFKTYLFYPDSLFDLKDQELDIIEENSDEENLLNYLNEHRDYALHNVHTRLLSLKGKEWASRILEVNHPLKNDFLEISQKISGYFFYKGQDSENIFIEHIASGKKFNLTKKSYEHFESLKKIDAILFLGIAKWRNEWWFSGISFQSDFNADLVLAEKNSVQSRGAVNFLDHQNEKVDELLEEQYAAFKDITNGYPIAFMNSDKVNDFIESYIEYFNNSLKLSKRQKEKAKERAKADGFFGGEDESIDFTDRSESALIFFNPKSGVEIAFDVNSAFPILNNPFFIKEDSEEHFMRLLEEENISAELAMYCITNFKSELPFFKEEPGKMYLADIDFLLRFWKKNNYFATPTITYTEGNKTGIS